MLLRYNCTDHNHYEKRGSYNRYTPKEKAEIASYAVQQYFFLTPWEVVAEMEEIPDSLIINWDQTGINYIPVSE